MDYYEIMWKPKHPDWDAIQTCWFLSSWEGTSLELEVKSFLVHAALIVLTVEALNAS